MNKKSKFRLSSWFILCIVCALTLWLLSYENGVYAKEVVNNSINVLNDSILIPGTNHICLSPILVNGFYYCDIDNVLEVKNESSYSS